MLKKRLFVLALALIMVFCLAGCSGGSATPSESAESPAAESESTAPESSSEAPAASSEESAEASDSGEASGEYAEGDPNHPIYSYDDALSLGGVKKPVFDSRAGIIGALPTETTDEPLTIGATVVSQSTAWFVELGETIQNKCAEYGWECNLLIPEFDAQKQSEIIDTFITQGVDAIIIDSVDFQTGGELVQRAVDAGIPCIGVGQQLDFNCPIITSIMSNSYEVSFNAGCIAAEKMEGESVKAATLMGKLGANSSESRMNGMMGGFIYTRAKQIGQPLIREDAMMAGQKMMESIRATGTATSDYDFEIVASNGDGQWTEIGGMTAAEDVLTGHPEINLLLVDQDFMGIGVVDAIEGMGLVAGGDDGIQVICGADSYRPALDMIREGKMLATGYGAASSIGESAVELIHMIFTEGYDASDMPISLDLPTIAIDASNVDSFYDENSNFAKLVPFEFMTTDEYNAKAEENLTS